jgi:triacylglycerol esterase/lipase EstA (alpha/beta hydrolase family)
MNQTQRRFANICLTLMLITGMLAPAVNNPGATASAVSGAGIAPQTFDAPASPAAPEDDYTISGRVTDSLGNPVPGVTISAATVSTPIVFVHGFGGLGVGMVSGIGCTDDDRTRRKTLEEANDYFGPLDDLIAQHRPVFYARLVSNPCFTPHLSDNVPYLIEAIDQAKQSTGQSKVIIIAHSMGGVISRAYIEGNGYRNDVESLFTLGSPHHGVPHDILSFAANGFTAILDWPFDWGTFCEDRQPGMCDFSLIGMSIFNQDHRLNRDVKYYFLTGDPPTISRNPLGLATDALFLINTKRWNYRADQWYWCNTSANWCMEQPLHE